MRFIGFISRVLHRATSVFGDWYQYRLTAHLQGAAILAKPVCQSESQANHQNDQ
jgi:hypothetical protein